MKLLNIDEWANELLLPVQAYVKYVKENTKNHHLNLAPSDVWTTHFRNFCNYIHQQNALDESFNSAIDANPIPVNRLQKSGDSGDSSVGHSPVG